MAPVGLAITWNASGASGRVSIGPGPTPRSVTALLAHDHGDGFAFEVGVGLAAHVDRHPVDRAAGEPPRHHARVVAGDAGAAVATHAQPLAADHELPRLRLDGRLTDLL